MLPTLRENNIFRNFDTLFDTILPEVVHHQFSNDHLIPMDLIENENDYVFQFVVGVNDKSKVSVSIDKGYLTVEVDNSKKSEETGKYLVREISYSKRRRTIKLNNYMNFSVEPSATLRDGILNIIVPKTEQLRSKKITIS